MRICHQLADLKLLVSTFSTTSIPQQPRLHNSTSLLRQRTTTSYFYETQCPSAVRDHQQTSLEEDSSHYQSTIRIIQTCPTHPPTKWASHSPKSAHALLRQELENPARELYPPPNSTNNLHSATMKRKDSSRTGPRKLAGRDPKHLHELAQMAKRYRSMVLDDSITKSSTSRW